MNTKFSLEYIILLFVVLLINSCQTGERNASDEEDKNKLFSLLNSKEIGIDFINTSWFEKK